MNIHYHALLYVVAAALPVFTPDASAQFLEGRTMRLSVFAIGSEQISLQTNVVVKSAQGMIEIPNYFNSVSFDIFDVDNSHASIRMTSLTNSTFNSPTGFYYRFSFSGGPILPFEDVTIGAHDIGSTNGFPVSNSRLTNIVGARTIDFDTRGLQFPASNRFVRIDISTIPRDVPYLTIDVSEVRLCWYSQATTNYQVQYRSVVSTNEWVNLGGPVVGNGTTNCITDAVTSPKRFYQVVRLP